MPRHARIRLKMAHKITAASVAAAGAAALAFTVVPGTAQAHGTDGSAVSAVPAAFVTNAHEYYGAQHHDLARQYWRAHHSWWLKKEAEAKAKAKCAAEAKARAAAKAKAEAEAKAEAAKKAAAKKAAATKAAATKAAATKAAATKAAATKASATKASATKAATATPASATSTTSTSSTVYANDLDGWIKHALAIMAANHIPGTYNGIYRNVMRESSGNPNAINLWDSNAAAGHPSKGLLQTIDSTFDAYHVAGTSWNIYDPVANIVAACNYAYHVYGSIDNVNGPY